FSSVSLISRRPSIALSSSEVTASIGSSTFAAFAVLIIFVGWLSRAYRLRGDFAERFALAQRNLAETNQLKHGQKCDHQLAPGLRPSEKLQQIQYARRPH